MQPQRVWDPSGLLRQSPFLCCSASAGCPQPRLLCHPCSHSRVLGDRAGHSAKAPGHVETKADGWGIVTCLHGLPSHFVPCTSQPPLLMVPPGPHPTAGVSEQVPAPALENQPLCWLCGASLARGHAPDAPAIRCEVGHRSNPAPPRSISRRALHLPTRGICLIDPQRSVSELGALFSGQGHRLHLLFSWWGRKQGWDGALIRYVLAFPHLDHSRLHCVPPVFCAQHTCGTQNSLVPVTLPIHVSRGDTGSRRGAALA